MVPGKTIEVDGFALRFVQGTAVIEVEWSLAAEHRKPGVSWYREALLVTCPTSSGPGCQCPPPDVVRKRLEAGHVEQWRAVLHAIQAGCREVAAVEE